MSEPNDEQFERYLQNFKPIDPEPLPVRTKTHSGGAWRRPVLAASVIACLGAAAFVAIVLPHGHEDAIEQSISLPSSNTNAFRETNDGKRQEMRAIALTKLALDNRQAFDEFMIHKNQSQFPPMNGERSALRVLAKE